MIEAVVVIATVINAVAAGGSAWFAAQTVKAAREQRQFQELERQERSYERCIEVPLRAYLTALSTEWYAVLEQGLSEIDTLMANRASTVAIALYSRPLTFSLRVIRRRAIFNLFTGIGMWNPAFKPKLTIVHDDLERRLAKILAEHVSKSVPARLRMHDSINVAIQEHSDLTMDMFAKYAPGRDTTSHPVQLTKPSGLRGPSAKDQV